MVIKIIFKNLKQTETENKPATNVLSCIGGNNKTQRKSRINPWGCKYPKYRTEKNIE